MADVQRRAYIKIGLIAIVSLSVLLVALSAALRSPVVMSRVLPPIQKVLKDDFRIDSRIGELSIDLFGRVSLRKFQASWENADIGTASAEVESVFLRFSLFELLRRNLQVTSVEMTSPKISMKLFMPQGTTEDKPPENPLAFVRQLIESPPVALKIDRVSVQNAQFDVRILDKKNEAHLRVRDLNFSASLLAGKKKLKTQFEVAVFPPTQSENSDQWNVQLTTRGLIPSVKKAELKTHLKFQFRTGVELDFAESATPQLKVESSTLETDFDILKLNADLGAEGNTSIDANQLRAAVSLPAPASLGLQELFALESASGPDFAKGVGQALFQTLSGLTFITKQGVNWKKLSAAVNLKTARSQFEIESQAGFDTSLKVSDNEVEFSSASSGFECVVTKILAKSPALDSLAEFVRLSQLSILKLNSPLTLKLSKPTFSSMEEPFRGLRVAELSLTPSVFVNNKTAPVFVGEVKLNHGSNGVFNIKADSSLDLYDELIPLMPVLKAVVSEMGLLQLSQSVEATLDTKEADLHQLLNSESLKKSVLNFDYGVKVKQKTLPPANSQLALQLKEGLSVSGKGRIQQLLNPSALGLSTLLNTGTTQVAEVNLNIENKKKMLSSSGNAQLNVPMSIRELSPLLNDLAKLGGLKSEVQWDLYLPHLYASALQLDFSKMSTFKPILKMKGRLNVAEKATQPLFDKQLLNIEGPIDFSLNARLDSGRVQLDTGYSFSQVGTDALARVKSVKGTAKVTTSLPFQNVVQVGVNAFVQELSPDKSLGLPPEALPYLKNIKARFSAKVDLKGAADVESVELSTGNNLVYLKAQGGSDLNAENSRFSGNVDLKLPETFRYGIRSEDKVDFAGRVRADWEATQKELKNLRLRGTLKLDNFTARHNLVEIEKVKGTVPFEQMLETPDLKSLRWSYLIRDNPFKRVDTSKFTPLTADDSLFTAERISVLDRNFGPLRARVSLKQNMLNVDKLDADLFEGVLAGQAFVDIQPSNFMTGIQGRITQLNTSLLSKSKKRQPPAPLSARLSLMLDLSRSLVEGRADVTEIGKNQLLAFIDVLDPDGVDSLLNKARLGLGVGYPRYVGLMMKNGFLDMNVALGGIVEQNVEITNLPLSPIVNAKTQDIVQMMREVPIQ